VQVTARRDRHGGQDVVRPPAQKLQHPVGFDRVAWLAEDLVVPQDDRVGRDDNAVWMAQGHGRRLQPGHAVDVQDGRLTRMHAFVDIGRIDVELEPRRGQQFGPTGRCGREDETHSLIIVPDIMQAMDSLDRVASGALRTILAAQPLTDAKVAFAWTMAAGPALSRAATVSLGQTGVVRVRPASLAWYQEVMRALPLLRQRMADLLGGEVVASLDVVPPADPQMKPRRRASTPRKPKAPHA